MNKAWGIAGLVLLFVMTLCAQPWAAELRFACRGISEMPAARSNAEVVLLDGIVYVIGGNDEKGAAADCWRYDPLRNSWSSLPSMREARFGHSAAACDGRIYVLGGERTVKGKPHFVRRIECFDPRTKAWSKAGTMPLDRSRFALVPYNGKLFLFGGCDGTHPALSRVDAWAPSTGRWERRKEMPDARNRCRAEALGTTLFVMGGEDSAGRTLASVLTCCAGCGDWAKAPPMTTARKNFASAVLGSRLIVAGGWDARGREKVFHSSLEMLRQGGAEWRRQGELSSGRDGVRAVASSGRVLFFGGYGGKLLSTVEEGRWLSEKSGWRIDEGLRFHLAYYGGDDDKALTQADSYAARPAPFFAPYDADISNINLKGICDLGFPLPRIEKAKEYTFFLKFFEYPETLDHRLSSRSILEPLLVINTGNGEALRKYLEPREHTVIKKGFIDRPDRVFTKAAPYPALRVLVTSRGGVTPQEFLDRHTPFSSLYVKPLDDPPWKGTDEELAAASAGGVTAFHREILSLLEKTFTKMPVEETASTLSFIDFSQPGRVRIVRVPRAPMVFADFRNLPMPQDPKSVFLTGLLLIYEDVYDRTDESRVGPVRSHVLEIGSIIDTRVK